MEGTQSHKSDTNQDPSLLLQRQEVRGGWNVFVYNAMNVRKTCKHLLFQWLLHCTVLLLLLLVNPNNNNLSKYLPTYWLFSPNRCTFQGLPFPLNLAHPYSETAKQMSLNSLHLVDLRTLHPISHPCLLLISDIIRPFQNRGNFKCTHSVPVMYHLPLGSSVRVLLRVLRVLWVWTT